MSTLAEIEEAIAMLPPSEIEKLVSRLLERASENSMPRHGRSITDFFGRFPSGRRDGAENEQIDAELAREAGLGL